MLDLALDVSELSLGPSLLRCSLIGGQIPVPAHRFVDLDILLDFVRRDLRLIFGLIPFVALIFTGAGRISIDGFLWPRRDELRVPAARG